jgi:hypothetical protein
VPSQELDLRFISVKLARKLVNRYRTEKERKREREKVRKTEGAYFLLGMR